MPTLLQAMPTLANILEWAEQVKDNFCIDRAYR